ncbi:MAG TPA: CerR family C-terminal domain-containing protein [Candidatus Hydrogenedentes bacterium]|nr:CerR family C-terminal domain-containing protein [Candidatus Hydrogenedentota bacterium]
MTDQRRGQETKDRILEAACKVFSEKGYRDGTHAEICRRAGTNVAAINYYFESKESLYRAVFEHLEEKAESLYPLSGGVPETAEPEQRLQGFIHAHLSRMFDPVRLGHLHHIRMGEIFEPTGLLDDLLERSLANGRKQILGILRELLGPQVPERDVTWCEMSIVGQCFMGAPGPRDKGPRVVFGLAASNVDQLAEHILRFSLAGVRAIREKYEMEFSAPSVNNDNADD